MKLMRYSGKTESAMLARLGVLVGNDLVADVRGGYARYLVERCRNPKGRQIADIYFAPYIVQFLHAGEAAWLALADAHGYLAELAEAAPDATGLGDEDLFLPLSECRLYAPLRPSKLICVAGNYGDAAARAIAPRDAAPQAFVKTLSAIVGPDRDIMKPAACRDLACQAALAVVIGKRCKHVSEADAYGVIAGYTILNDVAARDVCAREQAGGGAFLGRTCDTFAPTGPWMVTRGGLPDAMNVGVRARVNGAERQAGNTRDMLFPIPALIAHLSQITLMPGDVIATGAPGPAIGLVPGDVVECEIDGIGVLRNRVIDEPVDDSLNFSD